MINHFLFFVKLFQKHKLKSWMIILSKVSDFNDFDGVLFFEDLDEEDFKIFSNFCQKCKSIKNKYILQNFVSIIDLVFAAKIRVLV